MRSIPHVAFGCVVFARMTASRSTYATRGSARSVSSAAGGDGGRIAVEGVLVDEADADAEEMRMLGGDGGGIRAGSRTTM